MSTMDAVRPFVRYAPENYGNRMNECVQLAATAGLILDVAQIDTLDAFLGVREDGMWAAFECALNAPRQNGKGDVLLALEVAGVMLWGERTVIHSAHEFGTSLEAFRRLLEFIEASDDISRNVKRVSRSHGEEGVEFIGGARIRFRTRTRGGGRGFSCDRLILDEAMFLPEFAIGALLPVMSAMPNPQVIYTGSAADELVHENSVVWARLRERGIEGQEDSLAYVEYSVGLDAAEVTEEQADDQALWREANPAVDAGRIRLEHIQHERNAMDHRTFCVERLGAGAYPSTDAISATVISINEWDNLLDAKSRLLDPVCIAFEVNPERRASISAAGRRKDGMYHVEVIATGIRASQLPKMLHDLEEFHDPLAIVCNGYGPTASTITSVKEMGVRLIEVSAPDHAKACGLFLDAVNDGTLRHLGQEELRKAIRGSGVRPLSEAWVWSHKNSNVDIAPLVSATLALWAEIERPDDGEDLVIY
jgi:hypothetical protein